jgi:hypothetical protein
VAKAGPWRESWRRKVGRPVMKALAEQINELDGIEI